MARCPAGRAEVARDARPSDSSALPRRFSPSLKVTVPVGVPPVPLPDAVKVTSLPASLMEREAASSVRVAAFDGCGWVGAPVWPSWAWAAAGNGTAETTARPSQRQAATPSSLDRRALNDRAESVPPGILRAALRYRPVAPRLAWPPAGPTDRLSAPTWQFTG